MSVLVSMTSFTRASLGPDRFHFSLGFFHGQRLARLRSDFADNLEEAPPVFFRIQFAFDEACDACGFEQAGSTGLCGHFFRQIELDC